MYTWRGKEYRAEEQGITNDEGKEEVTSLWAPGILIAVPFNWQMLSVSKMTASS
jgi:hypothetical protein